MSAFFADVKTDVSSAAVKIDSLLENEEIKKPVDNRRILGMTNKDNRLQKVSDKENCPKQEDKSENDNNMVSKQCFEL